MTAVQFMISNPAIAIATLLSTIALVYLVTRNGYRFRVRNREFEILIEPNPVQPCGLPPMIEEQHSNHATTKDCPTQVC